MREIHPRALDLIMEFEGCHKMGSDGMVYVYPDIAHGWKWATQGYGTTTNPNTGNRLKKGDGPITKVRAKKWLDHDLKYKYGKDVDRLVKVPLSDLSRGALVSFCYNLGAGNLRASTLLKRINSRDWDDVPRQWRKWRLANGKVYRGLVRRREAELKLFMEGLGDPAYKEEYVKPKPEIKIPPPKASRDGFFTKIAKALVRWWFR